ncbi:hypothetical protein FM113_06530 [Leucobacter sp. 7(1)]|uniref:hypothetical protein n=1 Tax=Leucobacter sp. 7(1) TaxID=1255613 RepID=UPI00097F2CF0|nr:hypothetical protein [Leucobacter sp. 7(1)]SJN09535.1 hypothetical protein FM113_06530 [Leucobacter sp. 7(1)]
MGEKTDPRARRRFRVQTLIGVSPLFIGTVINGLIRPALARELPLTERRVGGSVRGSDRWWEADAETAADHPVLTAFLGLSDGAIGGICLLACVVLGLGAWLWGRRYPKSA